MADFQKGDVVLWFGEIMRVHNISFQGETESVGLGRYDPPDIGVWYVPLEKLRLHNRHPWRLDRSSNRWKQVVRVPMRRAA